MRNVRDILRHKGNEVCCVAPDDSVLHALALMALMECEETPPRRRALERGLLWFTTTRLPKRGSDWDNDTIWAALYGTVASVRAVRAAHACRASSWTLPHCS